MYQIFHADDILSAQSTFDNGIGSKGCTSVINLGETTFVDKVSDCFQVGIAPGDVGFTDSEHVNRGLIQLDEDTIVDLSQSEQLEGLPYFGMDLVNTVKYKALYKISIFLNTFDYSLSHTYNMQFYLPPDPHDESQLWLCWNVVIALITGLSCQPNFITFLAPVLLYVVFSPLEYLDTLVTLRSPFLQ